MEKARRTVDGFVKSDHTLLKGALMHPIYKPGTNASAGVASGRVRSWQKRGNPGADALVPRNQLRINAYVFVLGKEACHENSPDRSGFHGTRREGFAGLEPANEPERSRNEKTQQQDQHRLVAVAQPGCVSCDRLVGVRIDFSEREMQGMFLHASRKRGFFVPEGLQLQEVALWEI